jgi:type IV secretory pathway VirB3-like protein
VTRTTVAAWIGFALEPLVMLIILLSGNPIYMFIAVAVPLMSVFQIHKVKELQALQRAHPAPQTSPQ